MFHYYATDISNIELPQQFTYPFCYTPHTLSIYAAQEVQSYLQKRIDWQEELSKGKMFGVLVVKNTLGEIGYLAAFSGILAGQNLHEFFVPPVFDLLQPNGFFKIEEKEISDINRRIKELTSQPNYIQAQQKLEEVEQESKQQLAEMKEAMKKAKILRDKIRQEAIGKDNAPQVQDKLIKESQFQKAEYKRLEKDWKNKIEMAKQAILNFEQTINNWKQERKQRSATLQQRLFEQFDMLNARGERRNLCDIFQQTIHKIPPAGAGECAAPKLLQYAYLNNYKPLAMAEFWWGASPKTEIRQHGLYYPSCKGKCEPILGHMLLGLNVEANPLDQKRQEASQLILKTVYEDEWLVVVNKPTGMLSVPGKEQSVSAYSIMRQRYPQAEGPLIVHRLDMDTSGLLIIAKDKQTHQKLQALFHQQLIHKRYIALLEGLVNSEQGIIELPLCPNILDRPRQMVSADYGKPAITKYEVLERTAKRTRIAFYPLTGRTHQLRVHAAHIEGLHCPIVGDALYGTTAERLYLHAEQLQWTHPITGEHMCITAPAPF